MRIFEVHLWIANPSKAKQQRITGTYHTLLVIAEGYEAAKSLACKGYYRPQVRKCEEQFLQRCIHLSQFNTED